MLSMFSSHVLMSCPNDAIVAFGRMMQCYEFCFIGMSFSSCSNIESLCRDSRSSDIHCRQDNRLDHADARLQHSPIDYLSWAEGIEIGFALLCGHTMHEQCIIAMRWCVMCYCAARMICSQESFARSLSIL